LYLIRFFHYGLESVNIDFFVLTILKISFISNKKINKNNYLYNLS